MGNPLEMLLVPEYFEPPKKVDSVPLIKQTTIEIFAPRPPRTLKIKELRFQTPEEYQRRYLEVRKRLELPEEHSKQVPLSIILSSLPIIPLSLLAARLINKIQRFY